MIDRLKNKTTKTKNGTKKDLFKNQLEIQDKINEIIKEVSKIKSSLGDVIDVQMQKEGHLNFSDLPAKHEQTGRWAELPDRYEPPEKIKFSTVNKKYDMSKYDVENGVGRVKEKNEKKNRRCEDCIHDGKHDRNNGCAICDDWSEFERNKPDWKSKLEEARSFNIGKYFDVDDVKAKLQRYESAIDSLIKENEKLNEKYKISEINLNFIAEIKQELLTDKKLLEEDIKKLQQENEILERELKFARKSEDYLQKQQKPKINKDIIDDLKQVRGTLNEDGSWYKSLTKIIKYFEGIKCIKKLYF